jgi:hypothetical protein
VLLVGTWYGGVDFWTGDEISAWLPPLEPVL